MPSWSLLILHHSTPTYTLYHYICYALHILHIHVLHHVIHLTALSFYNVYTVKASLKDQGLPKNYMVDMASPAIWNGTADMVSVDITP